MTRNGAGQLCFLGLGYAVRYFASGGVLESLDTQKWTVWYWTSTCQLGGFSCVPSLSYQSFAPVVL